VTSAATGSDAEGAASVAGGGRGGALSHPRGLYILFFTEMWERFSYYGMRALLVPYMLNYLLFQPASSSSTYKWYTSLVYLTPLLGGFLADRFLGLRTSIVVGGILMAVGHFLMAFEPLPFFYAALGFLIAGNGFFKPNISTLVGKMYRPGDVRRDGAFTIFYMGINLGAFLAPLVCGTLRKSYGPHHGFAAAGIGMVIGLTVFLVGQKRVLADVAAAGNEGALLPSRARARAASSEGGALDPDESAPAVTGFPATIRKVWPAFIVMVGVGIAGYYALLVARGQKDPTSLIMPVGFLCVFLFVSRLLTKIGGAARDKSTVIFVLFVGAVLFWMGFEQAGNTLNIWADKHTSLRVGSFEFPAEWFQSVNAFLIFVLGLPFAAMWVLLAKHKKELPTPLKMTVGLFLVGMAFVPMVMGAAAEDATVSAVSLSSLPPSIDLRTIDAGRMAYDAEKKELSVHGVLPIFAVNAALAQTLDPRYLAAIEALEKAAKGGSEKKPKSFRLEPLPAGWRFPLDEAEGKKLKVVDIAVETMPGSPSVAAAQTEKLRVFYSGSRADFELMGALDAPTKGNLLAAGAPVEVRDALRALEAKSQIARVTGLWLFLFYLLSTLGELCLSPVGLSMVTKLAPARYASLFMGVWLLASSVAQYAGGSIGETWGTVTPGSYFRLFVWICGIGAVALAFLVKPLRRLMHDVH